MRHTHTETLCHTLGDEVITTPHANLAEWIKLTSDKNQTRLTKYEFGHHPRLGDPIKRPPREEKSRFQLKASQSPSLKKSKILLTSTAPGFEEFRPLKRAGWPDLNQPDAD
jgi:hypothetical protein